MSSPVLQPSPRARRAAAFLVLAIAALGAIAMLATDRFVADLHSLADADPALALDQAARAIRLLAVTVGLVLLAFAGWLLVIASRTWRYERYPPPGQRIIRETRVVTGPEARARARLGFLLAALACVFALGLPIYLWHVTASLGAH